MIVQTWELLPGDIYNGRRIVRIEKFTESLVIVDFATGEREFVSIFALWEIERKKEIRWMY